MNAVLVEDWAGAEAHLNRARDRARSDPNELVVVEHFAGWEAAVRGDAGTAMHHASAALELGQQLGDTPYLRLSRIVVGWATAMNGDERGADTARAAYAECKALSLRFLSPVHLLLCAEACAHHGQLKTREPWSWSRGRWRSSPVRRRSTTVSSRSLVRFSTTRRDRSD